MKVNTYNRNSSGEIKYFFSETPFGECLVAYCADGICDISFTDGNTKEALTSLYSRWGKIAPIFQAPQSNIWHNDLLAALESPTQWKTALADATICLLGTSFQISVWQLLTKIPYGTLTTYSDIATALELPNASRAVARAIATNKIALLVPCHRVIRSDGNLSGFRWGIQRKMAIIEWEKRTNNSLAKQKEEHRKDKTYPQKE